MIYDHSRQSNPYVSVNTLTNRQQNSNLIGLSPVQKRKNHTEVTDHLKSGLEDWTRMDISETRAHYLSGKAEIPGMEDPLQGKFEPVQHGAETPQEHKEKPLQRKENSTGMPDSLKTGMENLSGMDMSEVRVHYNSSKPSTVGALAYTQGTDIHVAPGQEKHLPHEAWHVVQQAQGRVTPTTQLKRMNVGVNDDAELEWEADIMGAQLSQGSSQPDPERNKRQIGPSPHPVIQRAVGFEFEMVEWSSERIVQYEELKKRKDIKKQVANERDEGLIEEGQYNKRLSELYEEAKLSVIPTVDKGVKMYKEDKFSVQGEVSDFGMSSVEFVTEPQEKDEDVIKAVVAAQKKAQEIRDKDDDDQKLENNDDHKRYQINIKNDHEGEECYMQATTAIRLERIPELVKNVKLGLWKSLIGFFGFGKESKFITLISKIQKLPVSDQFKGLLSLIAHYLYSGKTIEEEKEYPKAIIPVMARTWFPKMFRMVPELKALMQEEKKDATQGEQKAASQEQKVTTQEPKGKTDQVKISSADDFVNFIMNLPDNAWEGKKDEPFTKSTFNGASLDITREQWLKGIIEDKVDKLSSWYNENIGGMGEMGERTDIDEKKEEAPIFEFRELKSFGIDRHAPIEEWKDKAEQVLKLVNQVNENRLFHKDQRNIPDPDTAKFMEEGKKIWKEAKKEE